MKTTKKAKPPTAAAKTAGLSAEGMSAALARLDLKWLRPTVKLFAQRVYASFAKKP